MKSTPSDIAFVFAMLPVTVGGLFELHIHMSKHKRNRFSEVKVSSRFFTPLG